MPGLGEPLVPHLLLAGVLYLVEHPVAPLPPQRVTKGVDLVESCNGGASQVSRHIALGVAVAQGLDLLHARHSDHDIVVAAAPGDWRERVGVVVPLPREPCHKVVQAQPALPEHPQLVSKLVEWEPLVLEALEAVPLRVNQHARHQFLFCLALLVVGRLVLLADALLLHEVKHLVKLFRHERHGLKQRSWRCHVALSCL